MNTKPLLIAASVALSLFYVFILVLLLNPAVSDQYRRYYITRESQISAAELLALEGVAPGEVLGFTSDKLAFDGWSNPEEEFRWSLGRSPSLHFAIDSDSIVSQMKALVLRFRPLGTQRVSIIVNEEPVLSAEYNGSDIAVVAIVLPEGILREGTNTLRFDLPDARLPGNGDTRELGLALFNLRLNRT